jgi:hypothetical protein
VIFQCFHVSNTKPSIMKNQTKAILRSKALIAMVINALFVVQNAGSQTSLQPIFSIATWNPSTLSGESAIRYEKISSNAQQNGEIFPINIQNLATFQQNGRLLVDISGNDCGPSIFKARHVEYYSESNYLWQGEIEVQDHCQCEIGEMTIRSKDGEKFGVIQLGSAFYMIEDLTGGKNAIYKYPVVPEEVSLLCGVGGEALLAKTNEIVEGRDGDCTCQPKVKIGIYFTESAADDVSSTNNFAHNCIDVINATLDKSGINPSELRVELAFSSITYNIDETDAEIHGVLLDLQLDDDIKFWRDIASADLVFLIVNRAVMDVPSVVVTGTALGFCDSNPVCDNAAIYDRSNDAFSVVMSDHALNGNTIVHEFGHLMGADHEPCDALDAVLDKCKDTNSNTIPDNAHTWHQKCGSKTLKRKTIMYSDSGKKRLQQFSNPDVEFDGHPTGTDARDNARVLKSHACTVANYRTESTSVSVPAVINIFGDFHVCIGDVTELEAHVPCGLDGPFQYAWYKSHNGVSWGPIMSTNQTYAVSPAGFFPNDYIYVRLRVTSLSNNQVEYAYATIKVFGADTGECPQNIIMPPPTPQDVTISPNPVSDVLSLTIESDEERTLEIDLVDINGKIERVILSPTLVEGKNILRFSTNGMEKGIYFVRCLDKTGVVTKKLVVR